MDKETADVWLTTNPMFPIPSEPELKHLPRHRLAPFYFREVQINTSVYQLFRLARGMSLIPDNIDPSNCFYTVQIIKSRKASEDEAFDEANFDIEKASREARKKRDKISQNVIAKAEKDSFNRQDIFDFNLTISELFDYLRGKKYEQYRGKFELRIHIQWKEIIVQLNSNPDIVLILEYRVGESFDGLYRRSIEEHPEMHENIRSITYRTGPDTEILFLTKFTVEETHEVFGLEGFDKEDSSMRGEKVIEKTGEIIMLNEMYELNRLKGYNLYEYYKIKSTVNP